MPRERALSGTIPSMETSHEELKDNTIIIGEHNALPLLHPSHSSQSLGPLATSQRKKCIFHLHIPYCLPMLIPIAPLRPFLRCSDSIARVSFPAT